MLCIGKTFQLALFMFAPIEPIIWTRDKFSVGKNTFCCVCIGELEYLAHKLRPTDSWVQLKHFKSISQHFLREQNANVQNGETHFFYLIKQLRFMCKQMKSSGNRRSEINSFEKKQRLNKYSAIFFITFRSYFYEFVLQAENFWQSNVHSSALLFCK